MNNLENRVKELEEQLAIVCEVKDGYYESMNTWRELAHDWENRYQEELLRVASLPDLEWASVTADIMNGLASVARAGYQKDAQGMRDALNAGKVYVNKLKRDRDFFEHALGNLLAIIHRDGGHYQSEHGVDKAVTDAHQIWAKLIKSVEHSRDCLEIIATSDEVWEREQMIDFALKAIEDDF